MSSPSFASEPAFVRRKSRSRRYWSPNMARPFIDRSSEMWNFRCDRPLLRCPCSHEKGEAMKKTLMALGCRRHPGGFGRRGARARPCATRRRRRCRRRTDRRRHRRRRDRCRRTAITVPAIMDPVAITAGYGYVAGPAMSRSRLLLAAAALLGRLWLAGPQRPGLRLIPFTFIKSDAGVPENGLFSGTLSSDGLKKTVFSAHYPAAFTLD